MRSMGHPDYRYRPWPEDRRRRASAAGKSRLAAQRVPAAVQAWLALVALYRAEHGAHPALATALAEGCRVIADATAEALATGGSAK